MIKFQNEIFFGKINQIFLHDISRSKGDHVSSLLANGPGAQYWRHCDVVSTARNAQRARKRKMPQILAR